MYIEELIMKYIVSQIKKDAKSDPRAFDAIIDGNVDKLFFLTSYKEVCEIEADSLDEVFEIGNIGPESKIERLDRMHSVSVGDVIMNELNELWVVQPFGFQGLGR
jgi:hypothetical protein